MFCHLVGMTSAFVNPIMYALINDSFRIAFIALLRPLVTSCTKYTMVAFTASNTYIFCFNAPQTSTVIQVIF